MVQVPSGSQMDFLGESSTWSPANPRLNNTEKVRWRGKIDFVCRTAFWGGRKCQIRTQYVEQPFGVVVNVRYEQNCHERHVSLIKLISKSLEDKNAKIEGSNLENMKRYHKNVVFYISELKIFINSCSHFFRAGTM